MEFYIYRCILSDVISVLKYDIENEVIERALDLPSDHHQNWINRRYSPPTGHASRHTPILSSPASELAIATSTNIIHSYKWPKAGRKIAWPPFTASWATLPRRAGPPRDAAAMATSRSLADPPCAHLRPYRRFCGHTRAFFAPIPPHIDTLKCYKPLSM